ncbi:PspC domain-containing protein [Leucobacter japonicus]|uniref:PspC domain-containing protein n=1 Tax=Leucobacter japonicus TaxID=1461259 RepID=UPI0006A7D507|nr:PspC domain-containing protein [Leucobacter japonicus]
MTTEPNAERPEGPPPGQGFFDWLRGLDITRGSDRWLAGVAGGVAERLKLDPIIVRGVFVVLALLGGPGILIYLIGWLLLPDTDGRIHVEQIIRGRASAGMITAAVILTALVIIPAFFGLFIPGASFPGFSVWNWDVWGVLGIPGWLTATFAWLCWIAIFVLGFIWLRRVLLQRGRAESERAAAAGSSDAAPDRPMTFGDASLGDASGSSTAPGAADSTTANAQSFSDRAEAFANRTADSAERAGREAADWGRRAGEAATQWSRDVGKQADEWSARYADHHDAHRLGAAHAVITLALALLAGGLAALWVSGIPASSIPFAGVAPAALVTAIIAALAVLACSLIVAGVRGRHTGWVGFLSACGVVALLITVVLPWGTRFQPFGNMHVDAGGAPGAALIAGNVTVDLTDLGNDGGRDGDLEVWMVAGRTTIALPESEPTIVHVRMLAGRVDESDRTDLDGAGQRMTAGPFIWREIRSHVGSGEASSAHVITVTLLAGSVEFTGGGDGSDSSRADTERESAEDRSDRDALSDRAAALQRDLDEVNWRLDEPNIDRGDRRDLIAQRDDIDEQINALEMEMNR